MKVVVEAFAIARDRLGWSRRELNLPERATVADCAARLEADHPSAKSVLAASRFALDDNYIDRSCALHEGAVLSIIPPVSGGAASSIVDAHPIKLDEALAAVANDRDGAVVFFLGTVRNTNAGETVTVIDYEAKEAMAVRELDRLIAEAASKFAITSAFIRHRTGRVPVGESSVVIAVSAPHRAAAYEANAWLLDQLKKVAPIWKHEERLIDGVSHKVWLGEGGG